MWSKLNITMVENNQEINKVLFYNSEIIKNEMDATHILDRIISNGKCEDAFLTDSLTAMYIGQMCNEALNFGKEEMKKLVLKEIASINI